MIYNTGILTPTNCTNSNESVSAEKPTSDIKSLLILNHT